MAERELLANQIMARRYFYPSLNTLPYLNHSPVPISENTAKRVLCLPLFYGMQAVEQALILAVVNNFS